MVAPDSQATACLPSGRNSTYRPVQISGTGSGFTSLLDVLRLSRQPELLRRIAIKVWKAVTGRKDRFDETDVPEEQLAHIVEIESEILAILYELCSSIVPKLKDVQQDIMESE